MYGERYVPGRKVEFVPVAGTMGEPVEDIDDRQIRDLPDEDDPTNW